MARKQGTVTLSGPTRAGLALLAVAVAATEVLAGHAASIMGDPTMPWAIHLQVMEDAVKIQDLAGAARAWREAQASAMHGREWNGLIAIADARLRLGRADGSPEAARARAHELYLVALFRARQEGSLLGVLEAARAFAALGDQEVVRQAIRIAVELAGRDGEAQARVRAFVAEVSDGALAADAREGR